jgi:hypothetical protein
MPAYICVTCGVQHAEGRAPPSRCAICEDERQYVGWDGQRWTTLEEVEHEGHRIEIREVEPGLTGIGVVPRFGIGQRALLVRTGGGNVLWDCVGFIDDAAVKEVDQLGGIAALAFSHPHFYGAMVEWSGAFGDVPIYIPEADRAWVMRPVPAIRLWEGTLEPAPGVTLIQCGGHFEGSAVLHWAEGADGRGALLVGDSMTVVQDRRFVSFMRSYPNLIPLRGSVVRRIVDAIHPFPFDRVYGGWWESVVRSEGQVAVERSAARYIRQVEG